MSQWYDLTRHGLSVWLDSPSAPTKLVVRPILTGQEVVLLPDDLQDQIEGVSGTLTQSEKGVFQELVIPIQKGKLPPDSWWTAAFPASSKRSMASMCQHPVLPEHETLLAQWAWRVNTVRPDSDLQLLKGAVADAIDVPLVVFSEEDAHRYAETPVVDIQPINKLVEVTTLPTPAGQNVRWALNSGQLSSTPGLLDRLMKGESGSERELRQNLHALAKRYGMTQTGAHAFRMTIGEGDAAAEIQLEYAVPSDLDLPAQIQMVSDATGTQQFASASAIENKLEAMIDDLNNPKKPDDTLDALAPDTINAMVSAALHFQGAVTLADRDLYLLAEGYRLGDLRQQVAQNCNLEAALVARFQVTQNQAVELLARIKERGLASDESANWLDYLETGEGFALTAKRLMEADGTSLAAYRAMKALHKEAMPGSSPFDAWTALKSEVQAYGAKSWIEYTEPDAANEPAFVIRYSDPTEGTAYPIVTEMYANARAATSVNGERVPGTGFTDDSDWQADAVRVALQMVHGLDVTGPHANETAADDGEQVDLDTPVAPEISSAPAPAAQAPEREEWFTPKVEERLSNVRTLLVSRSDYPFADMPISEGVVMNASRPIMGDRFEQDGEFIKGRFYAAVPHDSEFADYNVKENATLHAAILYPVDPATLRQVALDNVAGKFAERLGELEPEKQERQVQHWISRLEEKPFSEIHDMVRAAQAKLSAAAPAEAADAETALPRHSIKRLNAEIDALNANISDPDFHVAHIRDDLLIKEIDSRTWEVSLPGMSDSVSIWHDQSEEYYHAEGAGATGKARDLELAVRWADNRIREMLALEDEATAATKQGSVQTEASISNQDLRGMAFTITDEQGHIKAQGTIPTALEGGSRLASFDYYRQLTHQHDGILWLTAMPDSPFVPKAESTGDEPRLFGYGWHEIQSMQKGAYNAAKQIAQLPMGAIRVYSAQDGLISPDADALPAKRSLKALLDRVKTMLRPAPSHKLLDAVAQRLNTPKKKAGENLEARHARFTDILSTLERYQDYTADQLNAEFKKKELSDICASLSIKTSSRWRKKQYGMSIEARMNELGVSFMDARTKGAYKAQLQAKQAAGEPIGLSELAGLVGLAGLRDQWIYTLGDLQVAQGLGLDQVVPKGQRGEHNHAFDRAEQYLELEEPEEMVAFLAESGLLGTPELNAFLERAASISNHEVVDPLLSEEFAPIAERLGFPGEGTFIFNLWHDRAAVEAAHEAALNSDERASEAAEQDQAGREFDFDDTAADAQASTGTDETGIRQDYGEFMPGARKHEYGSSFGWDANDLLHINSWLQADSYTKSQIASARELARKPKRDSIWPRPTAENAAEQGVDNIALRFQRMMHQMLPPSTSRLVNGRGREARYMMPKDWVRLGAGYAALVESIRDRAMSVKTADNVRELLSDTPMKFDDWQEIKKKLIPSYWHMSGTFKGFSDADELESVIEDAKSAAAIAPFREMVKSLPWSIHKHVPRTYSEFLETMVDTALSQQASNTTEKYEALRAFEQRIEELVWNNPEFEEADQDRKLAMREDAIMTAIEDQFGSFEAFSALLAVPTESASTDATDKSLDIELEGGDSAGDEAEELPTIHGVPSHKRPAPRFKNLKREGVDRRSGDITEEEFATTFGFRGIEYGNWCTQKDRTSMLNMAYDSFADMAEGLGVPRRFMGFNGKLGIAFGSRGRGKAAAHFEPANNVINLTKTVGAGALAHEWTHALDFELNRYENNTKGPYLTNTIETAISEDGYSVIRSAHTDSSASSALKTMADMMRGFVEGSAGAEQRIRNFELACKVHVSNMRRDMLKAKDLGTIAETFATATTNLIMNERYPDGYPHGDDEKVAEYNASREATHAEQVIVGTRIAAQWQDLTQPYFDEALNRLIQNRGKGGVDASEDDSQSPQQQSGSNQGDNTPTEPPKSLGCLLFEGSRTGGYRFDREHAAKSIARYIKDATQDHHVFAETWVRQQGFNTFKKFYMKAPEGPRNADISQFMESALALDGYRSGSGKEYWSNAQELLARGFSAVIHDRMKAKGIRNDFASRYSAANEFDGSEFITSPNPEGAERELFVKAAMPFVAQVQKLAHDMVGEPMDGLSEEAKAAIEDRLNRIRVGVVKKDEIVEVLSRVLDDFDDLPEAVKLVERFALDPEIRWTNSQGQIEEAADEMEVKWMLVAPILGRLTTYKGITDFDRLQDAILAQPDPMPPYMLAAARKEEADLVRIADRFIERIGETSRRPDIHLHAAYLAAMPEVPLAKRQALYDLVSGDQSSIQVVPYLIERVVAEDPALPADIVQRLEDHTVDCIIPETLIALVKADIGVDVGRLVDEFLNERGFIHSADAQNLAVLPGVNAQSIQSVMQGEDRNGRVRWGPYDALAFAKAMKAAGKSFDVEGMRQWFNRNPYGDDHYQNKFEEVFPEAEGALNLDVTTNMKSNTPAF